MKKCIVFFLAFVVSISAFAQEEAPNFVTFGKECPTFWGDDDYNQIFFVAVKDNSNPFYVWIYDPNCGGNVDEKNGEWNTQTKFALYGGEGAITNPDAKSVDPTTGITSGTVLKEEIFGQNPSLDKNWTVWGPIEAENGELVGEERIFKISVTGESGNDGNLYKIFISESKNKRIEPVDMRFFAYEVCFEMPVLAEKITYLNFSPERKISGITVYNFDADSEGEIILNTEERLNLSIKASGNDVWAKTTHNLSETEGAGDLSLNIGKVAEGYNDIVFYALDLEGNSIPIELPLIVKDLIKRDVEIVTETKGCNTVVFDASRTTDPNEYDQLTYVWDLGDGTKVSGIRVEHNYETSGNYPVTLTVTDNSGTICAISNRMVKVNINKPPIADAGKDFKGCPNASVTFDASRSYDSDGSIIEYVWDFGDGTEGRGINPTHVYSESGIYHAKLKVKDNSGTTCDSDQAEVTVFINTPPVADAGPDQNVGTTTVVFDGSGSYDPDTEEDFVGSSLLYIWDFGDGSASKQGIRPFHTYAQPGTYTVTLKVQDRSGVNCDVDSDVMVVNINKAPKAEAGEDKITCVGEDIQFDGSFSEDFDGSIVNYMWDFGDGDIGEGVKTAHSYSKPGVYNVALNIQDNAGTLNSRDVDILTVTINEPPIAIAGQDVISCVNTPIPFDGSRSYDSDGSITSFMWDFGDGATGIGVKPTHQYEKTGTYMVKLTITDDSGTNCATASDELQVIINKPPVANAGADIITCYSAVEFDGTGSIDPDGEILQYIWDFGDGTRGSGAPIKHLYNQKGTYVVTLTVRDNSGTNCDTHSDALKLTINSAPIADAGLDKIGCPKEVIHFDGSNSVDTDGSITAFSWDFGDGTPKATGAKVSHAYDKSGNYMVTLSVTDNSGTSCETSKDEVMVKINSAPIARAGADKKGCIDEPIRFSATSSEDPDGEIKKFVWDFGDGSPTVEAVSPSHIYTSPGTYKATLTLWDNSSTACNIATDELTVFINEPPIANAGEEIVTCNTTISFDGSNSVDPDGGILTYEWDFGDGTPLQGGAKPTHTFPQPGTYPIILRVYDDSGTQCHSHSDDITVVINQPPVANAGNDQIVCLNDVVSFNGSKSYDPEGDFLKYKWDFGDGTIKEDITNPIHQYEKGGIYNVILQVWDNSETLCNSSKDMINVQVVESPIAEAGEDKVVCAHTQVTFDGTKSTDTDGQVNAYYWNFGDGTQSAGPVVTHSYSKPGEYTVSLNIVGDEIGNCDNTDTDFLKVMVHGAPTAEAGEDVKSCPNAGIKFSSEKSKASSDIMKYEWNFGDGNTSAQANPVHSYAKPGVYQAKVKITDNSGTECNTSEDSRTITINAEPVADAGADIKGCINDILNFDGTKSFDPDGSVSTYEWDFGDGSSAKGVSTTHAYSKSGTYEVALTVQDNSGTECNTQTDTKIVNINQPPVADAGSRQVVCVDELVQFDGSLSQDFDGKIISYEWDFGDGAKGVGQKPTHTYKKTGIYQASLVVKDDSGLDCSKGTSAVTIVVNEKPIADAGSEITTCPGQVITFDGSNSVDPDGEIISYNWDFGDGTTGEWIKPTHKFEESGVYEVILTVTDNSGSNCATDSDKVKVVVNHPPVADAGPEETTGCVGCANDEVYFDASNSYDPEGGNLTYRWDFGDGVQGTGVRTFHAYTEPGIYTVTLIVTDDSGTICNSSTDFITVKVNKAPSPEIDVEK